MHISVYKGIYNYLVRINNSWFEMDANPNANGVNITMWNAPLLTAADHVITENNWPVGLKKNIDRRLDDMKQAESEKQHQKLRVALIDFLQWNDPNADYDYYLENEAEIPTFILSNTVTDVLTD